MPPTLAQCEACGRECPVEVEHVCYDRRTGERTDSLYFCSGTCWRYWARHMAQLPARPLRIGTDAG